MKSRGFSLLELIIYLAILSIISVILSASFLSLTRGRAQSESRTEVNSNIRFAMERIAQDISTASSIAVPVYAGTSNTLQLIVSGTTVLYSVTAGQLQRTEGANPADRVTSNTVVVDTPTFTRSDNFNSVLSATTTSVQTVLTMRYNSTSPEWSYTTTVRGSTSMR